MRRFCSIPLLAFIFFAGCGATAKPIKTLKHFDFIATVSARVLVDCGSDGTTDGLGSATMIGPSFAVTAKHVVEQDSDCLNATYKLEFDDGLTLSVTNVFSSPDDDISIVTLNGRRGQWAKLARPKKFDEVRFYAGGSDAEIFAPKVGFIGKIMSSYVLISIHVVPGNSGGGFINKYGQLVAVVSMGMWEPRKEFICLAVSASKVYQLKKELEKKGKLVYGQNNREVYRGNPGTRVAEAVLPSSRDPS